MFYDIPPSSINVPTVRLKSSACSGWAMEAPKVNYKCAVCGSYLEDSPNRTGIYCTHCGSRILVKLRRRSDGPGKRLEAI